MHNFNTRFVTRFFGSKERVLQHSLIMIKDNHVLRIIIMDAISMDVDIDISIWENQNIYIIRE